LRGQLKSYDDFKNAFTELLWDGTRQSEIRSRVYQDRYNCRSGESLSEYYIRYANMASMLLPTMSDQDLLGAMITHYEPSIQTCLVNANLKLTQEALAFLTKLQSLENSREQYRSAWRYFELQDQNHRTTQDQPIDSTGNRRPNGSDQVHSGRDRNPRGDSIRNPQKREGRRSFYGGQGRRNDGVDSQLNAAVQELIPCDNQCRDSSRSPNRRNDQVWSSNLNI
jgi:hypothetical protein